MKMLMRKFEDLMVAITFAEAGEYDTCKEILNKGTGRDESPETEAALQAETPRGLTENS